MSRTDRRKTPALLELTLSWGGHSKQQKSYKYRMSGDGKSCGDNENQEEGWEWGRDLKYLDLPGSKTF